MCVLEYNVSKNPKWIEAMTVEFNALLANSTWDLVPSQLGQNLVGCNL